MFRLFSARFVAEGASRNRWAQKYVRSACRGLSDTSTLPPVTPLPEITTVYPKLSSHSDLYDFSVNNSEEFWRLIGDKYISWCRPYSRVNTSDLSAGRVSWFTDGQLSVTVNCIERHLTGNADKTALIWEQDTPGQEQRVTYRELYEQVCKMSQILYEHCGVRSGDRVIIYMCNSPLAVISMLACTRVGAVHSVVFAGFSAQALASRIQDAGAKLVITNDQAVRGGKIIPLKAIVDEALASCPLVERVLVARRTGNSVALSHPRDILLDEVMNAVTCDPHTSFSCSVTSTHPMFMLYTSGSTGKPKGLVHSTAGYLLYSMFVLRHAFDYDAARNDVFACMADVGWITGHSYCAYAPLSWGGTCLLFESTPTYPDPGRYWEVVERIKPTHLYISPTALRLLIKYGDEYVRKYDRSSLRVIGCVGEPLNREAWHWCHHVIGVDRCHLIDTWWQTETGGVCLAPRPSAAEAPILPAMPMRPMYGIQPVLLDSQMQELSGAGNGALFLRGSWPGMAISIYGDHERFVNTYLKPVPGYFYTGDGSHRDEDGYYQITGRLDDVINVSGHRIGTAEIEDVINEHELVAESAVIGCPHEVKGEALCVYITLKDRVQCEAKQVVKEVRDLVRTQIASYAVPDTVVIVPGLPKTRSGKIMRRILKRIAQGCTDDLGDTSTLSEPDVVEAVIRSTRHS